MSTGPTWSVIRSLPACPFVYITGSSNLAWKDSKMKKTQMLTINDDLKKAFYFPLGVLRASFTQIISQWIGKY